MKATITRSDRKLEQFTVTLNPHAGSRSSVLIVDRQGLRSHLRDWKLGERAILAILEVPQGMVVSLDVGDTGVHGERRNSALVA